MFNSKKIVSDLSKRAMNKRLRAGGYTQQQTSKFSKYVCSYWKPGNKADRITVIFKGQLKKSQALI